MWLSKFIEDCDLPMVLDADALNIISKNKGLLQFLRGKAILTPHLGELERLIGKTENGLRRLEVVSRLAQKYDLVVIVKGAYYPIVGSSCW